MAGHEPLHNLIIKKDNNSSETTIGRWIPFNMTQTKEEGQGYTRMTTNMDMERHATLTRAIKKRIGVKQEAAEELAIRVLNYFGYGEEVIDNALDQEDRRLFYFLQDVSLLKTAWEEAILPSGRTWRIFYWYLNIENIEEFSKIEEAQKREEGLYEALPQDIWSREEVREEGS
jgi:hypothetical protein